MGQELDRIELEEVEDLSESLANDLILFSLAVRDRDYAGLSRFFPSQLEATPWPQERHSERVKWILHGNFGQDELESRSWSRKQYLEHWRGFLGDFSLISDVRFKVKKADFGKKDRIVTENSQFKFFFVAEDLDERPTWIKGTGRLDATMFEEGWKLTSLQFDAIDFYKSRTELFSEVSYPAGVSLPLPPYGSTGNDDFVYHGGTADDFDGDGWVDLLVTGVGGIRFYRNLGNGRFQESARRVGLPSIRETTGAISLDYDNDGDQDLFLAAVGQQRLFQNRLVPEGKLLFEDYSLEAGVDRSAHAFSATAGDVNRDGYPDIYVAAYNQFGRFMPNSWHQATNGTPNLLFINQGDGTFREVASEWGVRDSRWSYSAQFADLNGDHWLDLYVANDFGENALFINLEGEGFRDEARDRGVLDPGNGMGVSTGDFDNDGQLDLFITNMSSTAGNRILSRLAPGSSLGEGVLTKLAAGSSLFRGDGTGYFEDVTHAYGPFSSGWAWGGVFVDFDNDGWQDIYSPNGFVSGKSMKDT